ncbi:hypothetical protein ACH5RR_017384 [Cinchona calisaya]|uniref:Uncharacterized protein n=1 Tax=Cinchona calisaya TaxID=153742 RepID=A0ABD2ZLM2_9GENT
MKEARLEADLPKVVGIVGVGSGICQRWWGWPGWGTGRGGGEKGMAEYEWKARRDGGEGLFASNSVKISIGIRVDCTRVEFARDRFVRQSMSGRREGMVDGRRGG